MTFHKFIVSSSDARKIFTQSTVVLAMGGLFLPSTQAQELTVTSAQRASANQTMQQGIPESKLMDNAPSTYTVKARDTLWAIARVYLKTPWDWPGLWGMNMTQIKNPHRIYPGQVLKLVRKDGMAYLEMAGSGRTDDTDVVKLSPRIRDLADEKKAIPSIRAMGLETMLTEPLIVTPAELKAAARVVVGEDAHYMYTLNDAILVKSAAEQPLFNAAMGGGVQKFRIFNGEESLIRDPMTKEILGVQIKPVAGADLVRSEVAKDDGKIREPATMKVSWVNAEITPGDYVLPEGVMSNDVNASPHAPSKEIVGSIVAIYGEGVSYASTNQIVIINRGSRDDMDVGTVLAVSKGGKHKAVKDKNGEKQMLRLPDEEKGLAMVFRVFDKLSYALILEATSTLEVGDSIRNPF